MSRFARLTLAGFLVAVAMHTDPVAQPASAETAVAPPASPPPTLAGPTTRWQTLTLTFTQPGTFNEKAGPNNPFLDFRLQVTFTRDGQTISVPGFYAGNDGRGHGLWRVRFTPQEAGEWSYVADFRTGPEAAVLLDDELDHAAAVVPTGFHGASGRFEVGPHDPDAPGFAAKGRLAYAGGHYLRYADGSYFIKSGMDSPENWLGYRGFDNTQTKGLVEFDGRRLDGNLGRLHDFAPHAADHRPGDPAWDTPDFDYANAPSDGDDARNLIGAANYLASVGVNTIYFLVNNIGGDAKDSHPYANVSTPTQLAGEYNTGQPNDNLRFDVSKLEQWERFFTHAQSLGLHLHFVLNEREIANKEELDGATLGVERKLYYRELVARFGHHNSIQWNLSEEYDFTSKPDGFGNTQAEEAQTVIDFAAYLSTVDPHDHPLTVHNAAKNKIDSDPMGSAWRYFVGQDNFDLTSLQRANEAEGWSDAVENFHAATAAAGRPIAIMVDEPESVTRIAVGKNDDTDPAGDTDAERFNTVRKTMTWDIFLSGGSGVEWFVHNGDQAIEDFRRYEQLFRETAIARRFVEAHLPFLEMSPDDELVRHEDPDYGGAEVFAKPGEVYAIYLPDGSNDDGPEPGATADLHGSPPQVDLRGFEGRAFTLRWFDPRTGEFDPGTRTLAGGTWAPLGTTPGGLKNVADWVALITLDTQ